MANAAAILDELEQEKSERKVRTQAVLERTKLWLNAQIDAQQLTQVDLAVRTGMAQSTIFRLLRGRNVKMNTLIEIAEALGYSVRIEFDELA